MIKHHLMKKLEIIQILKIMNIFIALLNGKRFKKYPNKK